MKAARMCAVSVVSVMLAALIWAGSAAAFSGEIKGRVTDEAGEPVAGITVCAHGAGPIVAGECAWVTDGEGRYTIEGLQSASYLVDFHVEGNPTLNYVQQWWHEKAHPDEGEAVSVFEGAATEGIDAVMQAGGEITGKVTDSVSGEPIEGVQVCPRLVGFFQTGEVGHCAITDAAGEYAAKDLGTGEYQVSFETFEGPNYVAAGYPGDVSVTAGTPTEGVDIGLAPALQIEGDLTDAATGLAPPYLNAPFSTVGVCAFEPVTERRFECVSMAPDGHYALKGLPPASYVVGFAVDEKEDGIDLHPDGYVRRFWDEVQNFGEATPVGSSSPTVIAGIDARLSRGEEIWPAVPIVTPTLTPPAGGVVTSPPPVHLVRLACKKGFHKVSKGGRRRCVKIKPEHRPRKHHHQKARHR